MPPLLRARVSGGLARGEAWCWAALGLGLLVLWVQSSRFAFLCDDAFISFRYAVNLAEHGLAVYNVVPLERVEGYTNPLWVFGLAALHALGMTPEVVAGPLTFLGSAAGLGLAVLLVAAWEGGPRRLATGWVACLLALWPEYAVWSSGGLEGSLATAAILGALLAASRGHARGAAALAAIAVLTRPDALVSLAVAGVAGVLVRGRAAATPGARTEARAWGFAAPWFLVPVVVHLLWRHSFYGAWLPNTWAVKGAAEPLRAVWSGPYLAAWVGGLGLWVWAPLLAWARRSDLPWLAAIAAQCGYVAWVGGDFMAYGRLLLPATALAGVGIAVLLARATGSLTAKFPRARVHLVAGVVVGAFLTGSGARAHGRWRSDMERPEGWIDGKWEGVAAMDRFARTRVAAGAALRAAVPADTVIAVGAAGALPYTSRLPAVDVYGLVDPQLAREPDARLPAERARPGHVLQASPEYVRRRGAALWCHLGWVGHGTPPRARIPPSLRRDWTFGCVRTGAVPDPRSPGGSFDPGAYCCLRRQGVLEVALPSAPARGLP